jgi:hypothetical protein
MWTAITARADGRTDIALPAEERSMDETFLQIYGFYCDLGSYIGNQASLLPKPRNREYCRLTEWSLRIKAKLIFGITR